MSPNQFITHQRQLVKRTAASKAEYAQWLEPPERKTRISDYAVWAALAVGLVAAIVAGAAT